MRAPLASILVATLAAGCASPGAEVDPASTTLHDASVVTTALSATGTTNAYACAFVVVAGTCQAITDGDDVVALEAPGALWRVTAEVSWSEPSPATMWVWLVEGDSADEPLEEVTGDPPLSIDWDLSKYNDTKVAIAVYSMTYANAVVGGAGVASPVDFAIEGELLHLAPAGN